MSNRFVSDAAECRAQAKQYVGRPEEAFLLRVAREFELLDRVPVNGGSEALARLVS
jgi:hypothetical protein